jgi:hypothetical protein
MNNFLLSEEITSAFPKLLGNCSWVLGQCSFLLMQIVSRDNLLKFGRLLGDFIL